MLYCPLSKKDSGQSVRKKEDLIKDEGAERRMLEERIE